MSEAAIQAVPAELNSDLKLIELAHDDLSILYTIADIEDREIEIESVIKDGRDITATVKADAEYTAELVEEIALEVFDEPLTQADYDDWAAEDRAHSADLDATCHGVSWL